MKQFGFQSQNSTEYAILQLAKEIYESFGKQEYTLGVFVDLTLFRMGFFELFWDVGGGADSAPPI